MIRPSRRLVFLSGCGFGLALLPVFLPGKTWLLWLAGITGLFVMGALDALLILRPSSLTGTWKAPHELHPGVQTPTLLRLSATSGGRITLRVRIDVSELLNPVPEIQVEMLDGRAEVPIPLLPHRRGQAAVESAWVQWSGPLGLINGSVCIGIDQPIPVVPNLHLVERESIKFFRNRDVRTGLKTERFKGEGTEFHSLKEFLNGDDKRTIDWKSTARHQKLVARQFRAERNHQIVLAVDTGRLMSEPVEGIPRLDHALNAALLLAYIGLATGDRVGLFTFAEKLGVLADPQGGLQTFQRLARLTSRIEYSAGETNFTLGLMTLLQHLHRRSLVIVLTDFADTVAAELLLENLGRLSARHLVVFVTLLDPANEAWAEERPVTSLALHRVVTAGGLIRERRVVGRRLQRMGIFPIDAPPSAIGPQLVNRYLEIKRRERV